MCVLLMCGPPCCMRGPGKTVCARRACMISRQLMNLVVKSWKDTRSHASLRQTGPGPSAQVGGMRHIIALHSSSISSSAHHAWCIIVRWLVTTASASDLRPGASFRLRAAPGREPHNRWGHGRGASPASDGRAESPCHASSPGRHVGGRINTHTISVAQHPR